MSFALGYTGFLGLNGVVLIIFKKLQNAWKTMEMVNKMSIGFIAQK